MEIAYFYLALSGALTVLLWTPYVVARLFVWGLPSFLRNYPEGYPEVEPTPPVWAQRAQRAHLNMVETMPAFIAVVLAATYLATESAGSSIAMWAQVFFFARVAHAVVFTAGVPYLRTPTYLVSWLAVLMIAAQVII